MSKLKAGVILLLLVGLLGGFAGYVHLFFWSPASSSEENILFEVKRGTTLTSLTSDLQQIGLVRDPALFQLTMKIHRVGARLKAGEYSLRKNMSPAELVDVLTSGKSVGRLFRLSEGLNMFEIAELFEAQGFGTRAEFLKVVRDPAFAERVLGQRLSSLEGYLFPETYSVTKFMTTEAIVEKMLRHFLRVYEPLNPQAKEMGWSRHQVVTLASIIEKETGAPEERPVISSVFHNRLRKRMRLQTDPTIIYGKALQTGRVEISITRKDLTTPNPYNTYTIPALPPGPIANPGFKALEAALNPDESEYLYFVSRNDGTHVFSKDYADHKSAVEDFQKNPEARKGKSWRDLNKPKAEKNPKDEN